MSASLDTLNFVKEHELFYGLTEKQIQKVAQLISEKNFLIRDVIIKENDISEYIYLLSKGSVEAVKEDLRIATLNAGGV